MTFPPVTGVIAFYQGAAIGAALLTAVVYHISAGIRRDESKLEHVFTIALSAVGLVLGLRIIVLTCTSNDLGPFKGDDVIYIVLGGIALIWVCTQQIRSLLWPKPDQ